MMPLAMVGCVFSPMGNKVDHGKTMDFSLTEVLAITISPLHSVLKGHTKFETRVMVPLSRRNGCIASVPMTENLPRSMLMAN